MHGDEGEMNIWTLWCIHAVQLVVRTHHKYMFMAGMCTSCRVLFIISFHDVDRVHVHAQHTAARNL